MRAVIFDRDGVILDSELTNIRAAEAAFQKLDIEIQPNERAWVIGRHPADYVKLFQEKYDFSQEEFERLTGVYYYELLAETPFFDGVVLLVKQLRDAGISLALTTSSDRNSTENILKSGELDGVFDVIVTREDCGKRKPDPEPYRVTAERLAVEPSECVVIEDTSLGVESAKQAGMKCIAVPNEYTKDMDFTQADLVVGSAENIDLKLLQNL